MKTNFLNQHKSFVGSQSEKMDRMLREGVPKKTIARELGVSISTIRRYMQDRYGSHLVRFENGKMVEGLTEEEKDKRLLALKNLQSTGNN